MRARWARCGRWWRCARRGRRALGALACACAALYACALLLGDVQAPQLARLTALHRCPACYGVAACPELYSGLVSVHRTPWTRLFNAKNVYRGSTRSGKQVMLKKLAHDWELNQFDRTLCSSFDKAADCKPEDLLNVTNMESLITDLVKFDLKSSQREVKKGLVLCPYTYSVPELIQPVLTGKKKIARSVLVNVWTMLKINPEPIILQLLPASGGWPTPVYGGACGRLTLVTYSGEPLSNTMHVDWMRRLKYADQILRAAMDFTFKHDRFRFYFMDWSLDNIAVDNHDRITFVDLEDVIILDKDITPGPDLPEWYMRYNRGNYGPGFTFSIEKMCKHHLSDHNIWAACYILAGDDSPLLLPIPDGVNRTKPQLYRLLEECLHNDNKFKTVSKLQQVISDVLSIENGVS